MVQWLGWLFLLFLLPTSIASSQRSKRSLSLPSLRGQNSQLEAGISRWQAASRREVYRLHRRESVQHVPLRRRPVRPAPPYRLQCPAPHPERTRAIVPPGEEGLFEEYGPEARAVLDDILEKYVEYGTAQFQIPEILKVPPISERGTVTDIIRLFGGASHMRDALAKMQQYLYAA